jgi:hypothetical protein
LLCLAYIASAAVIIPSRDFFEFYSNSSSRFTSCEANPHRIALHRIRIDYMSISPGNSRRLTGAR